MIFDEENNKMVAVDEYYDSILNPKQRYYKCSNIETMDGTLYNICVVRVPAIDLSEASDRYENLVAVTGALEAVVGEVERFSMEEHEYAGRD